MSEKVTIYKITCTEAYMMAEQGTRYSLTPWGKDTMYYSGEDDGGREYILPAGFRVDISQDGTPMIYDDRGHALALLSVHDNPGVSIGEYGTRILVQGI